MTALHDLAADYAALRSIAHDLPDGIDDSDLEAALLAEIKGALADKVEALLTIHAELEGDAATLEVEAARLTARAGTIRRRADRLREYVRACVVGAGVTKLLTKLWTVSLREGSQRVEVKDETLLPADYWRMVQSVDKAKISAELKAGREVPGAELVRGEKTMVVR